MVIALLDAPESRYSFNYIVIQQIESNYWLTPPGWQNRHRYATCYHPNFSNILASF